MVRSTIQASALAVVAVGRLDESSRRPVPLRSPRQFAWICGQEVAVVRADLWVVGGHLVEGDEQRLMPSIAGDDGRYRGQGVGRVVWLQDAHRVDRGGEIVEDPTGQAAQQMRPCPRSRCRSWPARCRPRSPADQR